MSSLVMDIILARKKNSYRPKKTIKLVNSTLRGTVRVFHIDSTAVQAILPNYLSLIKDGGSWTESISNRTHSICQNCVSRTRTSEPCNLNYKHQLEQINSEEISYKFVMGTRLIMTIS